MPRHDPAVRHGEETDPSTTSTRRSETGDGGRLLADAISSNAVFSAVTGGLLLFGGFAPAPLFRVDAWLLSTIGGGLIVFAAVLVWLLSEPRRLVAGGRGVVAADAAWIGGTGALLALSPSSALSAAGRVALVAVSAMVAVIAAAQVIGLHRAGSGPVSGSSPIALRVRRLIPVATERVWAAVADAGGYARFAPGIAATTIVSGEGPGMVRVCTDDQGGQWAEHCTLWDEGHRYRMTVDVSTYPISYRMLLHEFAQTWTVERVGDGTQLTLAFDGAVKLGVIGRAAARILGSRRRLEPILDAYEQDLTIGTDPNAQGR